MTKVTVSAHSEPEPEPEPESEPELKLKLKNRGDHASLGIAASPHRRIAASPPGKWCEEYPWRKLWVAVMIRDLEAEVMANHESSSVTYSLECSSCGHEWSETAEVAFDACPACGAAVEKSSGHFGIMAEAASPSKRRPSGTWGWAEAIQSKR